MKQKEHASKKHEGEEFYEHKPKREFKASLSKDGRYWIFKDVTTHIVSREYLEKIEKSPREIDSPSGDRSETLGARNAKGN